MTKEVKIKLIKKIVICIIPTILCIYGFILRLNGYGLTSEVKKDLTNIVKVYNSLSTIKNNRANIIAKYEKKSIIVNYSTKYVDIDYTFKYQKENNNKILTITYSETDFIRAEEVIKAMIESLSIIAGNKENDVFSNYKYKDFYKTKLKDGVQIQSNEGIVTAQILLETNLLDNIKDIFFEESIVTYISIEDLKNFNKELKENKTYLLSKGNIMIYVVENNNNYEIYSSDKQQNVNYIYESIMSVINLLNQDVYTKLIISNIDITNETTNDIYSIDIKPEKIANNQKMNNNYVVKFTLNK